MLDIRKRYIIYIVFTFLFGIIYEMFSHNVYTPYMYLSFIFPLMGYIVLSKVKLDLFSTELVNICVLSFTIGFIVNGILYIYGTTNSLSIIYFYIGLISLIILIINIIYKNIKKINNLSLF